MNSSEQQYYQQELENIIYQLGELMLDIIQLTLKTFDDYQQAVENSACDQRPFQLCHHRLSSPGVCENKAYHLNEEVKYDSKNENSKRFETHR